MKGLSPRQHDLLAYISEHIRSHGYSPSYRDIMQHFSFSSLGTVFKHIQSLKKKGVVVADPKSSRSLNPQQIPTFASPSSNAAIPFIGYLSEGKPIETFQKPKSFAFPSLASVNPEKTYILQVRGDTLREELLDDGDFLIIEACQTATPGSTVIAVVNQHETVVKRYYPEGSFVYLTSCNPQHKPIIVKEEDFHLHGIVISTWRMYKKQN